MSIPPSVSVSCPKNNRLLHIAWSLLPIHYFKTLKDLTKEFIKIAEIVPRLRKFLMPELYRYAI